MEEELHKVQDAFSREEEAVKDKVEEAKMLKKLLQHFDDIGSVEVESELVSAEGTGAGASFSVKAWSPRLSEDVEHLVKISSSADVSYDKEIECFVIESQIEINPPVY